MPQSIFNRKLLPIPHSRPIFKLVLILLLAGDVSLNPGPAVRGNIRLATTNICFIQEKTTSLSHLLISKTIDILAITETWLRPHNTAAYIADISPPDYAFHHRPCPVGRGDGVGFLISKLLKANLDTSPDYASFESMCVLTYQIRAFLGILFVFITLQVTQLISLKNKNLAILYYWWF